MKRLASRIGHFRLVDENLITSSIEMSSGMLRIIPSRDTRKLRIKASKLNLPRESLEETILLADFPSKHSSEICARSDFSIRLMRPGKAV